MNRRSLLYQSKVEYGGWTINHVQGCSHGCTYPCYAMSLGKRTGRVRTYEDWRQPELVENAVELLEAEVERCRGRIPNVHLSFTTDPFMWDSGLDRPNQAVVDLTLRLIRILNSAGIRVSTLTKGVYPDYFVAEATSLHPDNQYGVSVVSLSETFRARWEPGAAPIDRRLRSVREMAAASLRTWVSVEPYPTPNVDPTAVTPDALLEALLFAECAVFGRWNYNALVNSYEGVDQHYLVAAQAFADWAQLHGKLLHIKKGTPLCEQNSVDILGEGAAVVRLSAACG